MMMSISAHAMTSRNTNVTKSNQCLAFFAYRTVFSTLTAIVVSGHFGFSQISH